MLTFRCKDFLPAIAPTSPLLGKARGVYKLRDDASVPLICPTCQNVFAGSLKAIILLCMGLFSIFWLGGGRQVNDETEKRRKVVEFAGVSVD